MKKDTKEVSSLTVDPAVPEDVPTLQAMLKAERIRNADMAGRLATSVPMLLSYQPYVTQAPLDKGQLWEQACSADKVTTNAWSDVWLKHIRDNVADNAADTRMVGDMFGAYAYKPALCVASGPSLNKNFHLIKEVPADIPVISCLHNFHKFIDTDTKCTAFLTLDAGDVVISEVSEGGAHDEKYYWDATKDYTLIAGLVSPPELIKKWKGEVKFFNATIPDEKFMQELPKITKNKWVYSVGGNTFGAVMYHAAWVWGCRELALMGADFAFDYMHKFHSWDSAYDKQFAGLVPCTDVWGNRVYSWQSYQNFRFWTEFQCQGGQSNHHIRIVNCTEGGTFGAYPHGNVMWVEQKLLKDWIDQSTRWVKLKEEIEKRKDGEYLVMW